MRRGLLAFTCVSIALVAAAMACAAPARTADTPTLPPVEATSVRRTAVADVQRIIANNPTPTQIPEPTATAGPTCQGAIWWHEARSHIGESKTVQGLVVAVRPAPNKTTLLELGQPYPDPTGFSVLVPGATDPQLTGKTVCVSGKIARIEGVPSIQLPAASLVVVVAASP